MNKNHILIVSGIVIFVAGSSILAYEIFGDSDLNWSVETEVSIIFYVMIPGMIICGVGGVLEFARKAWSQ